MAVFTTQTREFIFHFLHWLHSAGKCLAEVGGKQVWLQSQEPAGQVDLLIDHMHTPHKHITTDNTHPTQKNKN